MNYLAVLGRQPEISIAELAALFSDIQQHSDILASFSVPSELDSPNHDLFTRLGGSLKIAQQLPGTPLEYLKSLPAGKITLGLSDYSPRASQKSTHLEALKFKKILVRHGRSVRIVENKSSTLSTATSLHNGLSGKNPRKVELIKTPQGWYRVVYVQDIDAYAKRDQARPARDAKVGMLPPKLAQILINLCGPLAPNSTILDPFCGTGVVLQEALLMGYHAYGTDLNERMIEYSQKNLTWLKNIHSLAHEAPNAHETAQSTPPLPNPYVYQTAVGDATSFRWAQPIDAIACEGYLGKPFSQIPTNIALKTQKQECSSIILGFLKNLSTQIQPSTPVTIAIPAWLRSDGTYERLNLLDQIEDLGYNVNNKSRKGLLYHRADQVVARDIIILRKN